MVAMRDMEAITRAKRVTNLFLHDAGGGSASSGSDHDGAFALDCFLDGFFLDDDVAEDQNHPTVAGGNVSDDEDRRRSSYFSNPLRSAAMVRDLMNKRGDRFKIDLFTAVLDSVDRCSALRGSRSGFRRAVMGSLREMGYNAGLCKSRWDSSGGITAGTYEYIDVVRAPPSGERYIVDVEFTAEFEIARPTDEYVRILKELPRVFVGRAEELKQAVRIVAEEAKRSMRDRDMHVPPWRKARYMNAKWLGPYKRTTTTSTASVGGPCAPPPPVTAMPVQCRAVGFDPVPFVIPPLGRIR